MRTLRSLVLAAVFIASAASVSARLMGAWSYQQLLDKSDLVAIAVPVVTNDTKEEADLPGYTAIRAIAVETHFKVLAVLKGDKATKEFVLRSLSRAQAG